MAQYTGFGKTLRKYMVDRDVRSWTQLSRRIERRTSVVYSHQVISKYAYGKAQVPTAFVQACADALELPREERRDLAEQYAYHS